MQVKFKKLHENASAPWRNSEDDAGFDLTAVEIERTGDILTIHTGIAVEIPKGFMGLLFPRSSIYKTSLALTNSVGVIDCNYRGEIMCKFRVINESSVYSIGDRCCQLIIQECPKVNFIESETLSETSRNTGGFGSSGK